MKRNLVALALVLFFGNVLFASAQVAPAEAELPVPATLVVSEYGTLLNVLNADGTSRFGTLNRDGFLVRYSLGGAMKTVQAIGATAGEALRSGQVTVEGNSTIVTVKTADDALEITNSFTLDEQTNRLIIRRSFRNISGRKLSLQTSEFLDPNLMGPLGPTPLKTRALQRIKASGCNDHGDIERPPHTPCITIVCPNVRLPRLVTPGDRVSLKWKCPKTVNPKKERHFAVWLDLGARQ